MSTINLSALKKQYKAAKVAYYNSDPIMTDAQFDKLEASIRKLDPDWKELHATGVRTEDKKTEADLEHFMPSLNKVYPEDVAKRLAARPQVKSARRLIVMHKLDGTSLQLVYDNKVPARLITRGDGARGGDISFMLPWLVKAGTIPGRISERQRTVFRCEGLMDQSTFSAHWSRQAKGKNGFDNIRNMVNGLFNRKDRHPALRDVDIVVLGVYGRPLEEGLIAAEKWGFATVAYTAAKPKDMEAATLSKMLATVRSTSRYEMDGLVIADSVWVYGYDKNEKPKFPLAFKMNDEQGAATVEVLEVVWQKTRTGRWQPKIKIPPTVCDGATVTNVTANNPLWMQQRGVGPGAKVKVLRSGGVIPKIVEVVTRAEFTPPPGAYTVNGAYFMVANDKDPMVKARAILHFLTTLGVENIALKTVVKLHDSGILKSTMDYVKWSTAKTTEGRRRLLMTKAGLGPKQAQIIDEQIVSATAKTIPLRTLMVASGFFDGVGDRKFGQLEAAGVSMDDLMKIKWTGGGVGKDESKVYGVRGFSSITVQKIVEGLDNFKAWFELAKSYIKVDGSLPKAPVAIKGPLTGIRVSWTGYRDKQQEEVVIRNGGEVVAFSAKTDVLLYTVGGKKSSKVEKAGPKAMTWVEFLSRHKVMK